MVNAKDKSISESNAPLRRRGRPTGKNRLPLSREERRARNAQYERERREETAEAMAQLAEATGCGPNITNADLLVMAITQIQRAADSSDEITDLVRINSNLESQIATLQARLGLDDASFELLENNQIVSPHLSHRERSHTSNRKRASAERVSKRKRTKHDPSQQTVVPSMVSSQQLNRNLTSEQPSVVLPAESITFDLLTDRERQLLSELIDREILGMREDVQSPIPIGNATEDLFPDLL